MNNQLSVQAVKPPQQTNWPLLGGVGGALVLFSVFFGFITLTDSIAHAWGQFTQVWYWVTLLAVGFGVQLGLYIHLRRALQERKSTGTTAAGVAASGGVSTVSMLACCAHLLPGFLPLLGLSAASVILVQYQLPLILLGVFSNLVGITIMLTLLKNHGFLTETSFDRHVFPVDYTQLRNGVAIVGIVVVIVTFMETDTTGIQQATNVSASSQATMNNPANGRTFSLSSQTNDEKNVEIEVTPTMVGWGQPLVFSISLSTHSGSLDVAVEKSSFLVDDLGNTYWPTKWDGDPPGGHHRSGELYFPALKVKATKIKLTIQNVNSVPARLFQWSLS